MFSKYINIFWHVTNCNASVRVPHIVAPKIKKWTLLRYFLNSGKRVHVSNQQTTPMGQMCFIAYFCRALRAKNVFYICWWLKKSKEKYFDMRRWYEIQILMSINKVFLKDSHDHSLCVVYGWFHMARAPLSRYFRDSMAYKD